MRKTTLFLLIIFSAFWSISCRTTPVSELETFCSFEGWNSNEYVFLDSGWIEGREAAKRTWCWTGIPYAKPPLGSLRWKAPRPVEPWREMKQATDFSSPANQLQPVFSSITGSEDCLYLNIWRPQSGEENLPVYVWLHGGGNSKGSANLPDFHGNELSIRLNAVFVSINYRLGPLGWFRHPLLQSDNALDNSGNYGLLDIIAALRWVQRNIGAFGGNPDNVTLSGESSGANNTLALMLSTEAEGLFHKAIVQSGYKNSASVNEAEAQAMKLTSYLTERRGVDESNLSSSEIREILFESSPAELFKFYDAGKNGMIDHLYHIEDGLVFPENGWDLFASGDYPNKVPMIIGSNKDEMKLFLFFDDTIDRDSALFDFAAGIGSLRFREEGVDDIASAVSGNIDSPAVFAYRFDWGSPDGEGTSPLPGSWGRRLGAMHTLEIPFFLGTDSINGPLITALLFNNANRTSRNLLRDSVMAYTYNFIRTGTPNPGGASAVIWPEWDESRNYLIFNANNDELDISVAADSICADQRLAELQSQTDSELYLRLLEKIRIHSSIYKTVMSLLQ